MQYRLVLLALVFFPASLPAQGDCFPPDDSNEAKVFATFTVPLAFGPGEAPAALAPWQLGFAVEASTIPNIDDATATPTVCRPGKGPENTDFAAILPRPRVRLGLPAGLVLEASWVPPVSLNGATPNLVGVSLARTFSLGSTRPAGVSVRLHGTAGRIEAPITCDQEALQDPVSECFNGTESNDRFRPNTFGAELAGTIALSNGRVRPFAGTGINLLRPRFQVHFVNQFDQLDNRKVEVDLQRLVVFAGITWTPRPRLGLTAQVYSAPADAVTGRLAVRVGH